MYIQCGLWSEDHLGSKINSHHVVLISIYTLFLSPISIMGKVIGMAKLFKLIDKDKSEFKTQKDDKHFNILVKKQS